MKCPRCNRLVTFLSVPGAFAICEDCPTDWSEYMAQVPSIDPNHIPHLHRDPLLVEREKTHGSFTMTAKVAQEIKEALRWGPLELKPAQLEALEMIATKMARIVCGSSNCKDHYNDIAGYAKLGAEACE